MKRFMSVALSALLILSAALNVLLYRYAADHCIRCTYNTRFLEQYKRYTRTSGPIASGNDIPFFSVSSTTLVLAGFVAILRGIAGSLTPEECRALLMNTSYSKVYEGQASFERGESPRVADIGAAVRRVLQND